MTPHHRYATLHRTHYDMTSGFGAIWLLIFLNMESLVYTGLKSQPIPAIIFITRGPWIVLIACKLVLNKNSTSSPVTVIVECLSTHLAEGTVPPVCAGCWGCLLPAGWECREASPSAVWSQRGPWWRRCWRTERPELWGCWSGSQSRHPWSCSPERWSC